MNRVDKKLKNFHVDKFSRTCHKSLVPSFAQFPANRGSARKCAKICQRKNQCKLACIGPLGLFIYADGIDALFLLLLLFVLHRTRPASSGMDSTFQGLVLFDMKYQEKQSEELLSMIVRPQSPILTSSMNIELAKDFKLVFNQTLDDDDFHIDVRLICKL